MDTKATEEITKRFRESWKETQRSFELFDKGGFEKFLMLKKFINELSDRGENRHFRLGFSLYRLIFSRSVERGLRIDQKFIRIDTIAKNDYEVVFRDGERAYREYRI